MVHVNIHAEETVLLKSKAYTEKRGNKQYSVLELTSPPSAIAFYANEKSDLKALVEDMAKAVDRLPSKKGV